MVGRELSRHGTLVLDSEGLSKLADDREPVVALVTEGRRRDMEVVTSALTIIEATHSRTDKARLAWLLSGIRVVPVGEEDAKRASALLLNVGLHGHNHAIDAVVADTALRQPRPVAVLTSDVEDMTKLCGDQARIIAV